MEKKTIIKLLFLSALVWGQATPGINPVMKSLFIPGTGEYALNHPIRGRVFILSETLFWTAFTAAVITSNNFAQRYQAMAADFAGVDPSNKDYQYWVDIGNYQSLEDHNEEHLRYREYDALYPSGSDWDWTWSSDTKREQFEDYRITSDLWAKNAKFIAGAIFLNHVISAIDVMYLIRKQRIEHVSVTPLLQIENNMSGISIRINF